MIEIWRDIKDYEGLYQVSNFGRVRSLGNGNSNRSKVGFLKGEKSRVGYLRVVLYKDGKGKHFLIHRLVAEAFIPNPLNLQQVNHKNEDKTNNRVDNLEWCECDYNINYGTRTRRVIDKLINGKKSKPVLQFSKSGEFIGEFPSGMEIQRQLGYDQRHISNCCNGRLKSAYGYIWKFKTKKEVA